MKPHKPRKYTVYKTYSFDRDAQDPVIDTLGKTIMGIIWFILARQVLTIIAIIVTMMVFNQPNWLAAVTTLWLWLEAYWFRTSIFILCDGDCSPSWRTRRN